MYRKSALLPCLEDVEGFVPNEPEKADPIFSPEIIRDFLDILIKVGSLNTNGFPGISFHSNLVTMIYVFGMEDDVQKNPSFNLIINSPYLYSLRSGRRYFLDNGLYFCPQHNYVSQEILKNVLDSIDRELKRQAWLDTRAFTKTRLPLLFDLSHLEYMEVREKENEFREEYNEAFFTYHEELDIKVPTRVFGSKYPFYKFVSSDLKGFEIAEPDGDFQVEAQTLRGLWFFCLAMGGFDSISRANKYDLVCNDERICLLADRVASAYKGSHLSVKVAGKYPRSRTSESYNFVLKNGLRIYWEKALTPLGMSIYLRKRREELGQVLKQGYRVSDEMPIFLDKYIATINRIESCILGL